MKALDVMCSSCGAEPDQRCRVDDLEVERPHRVRVRSARYATTAELVERRRRASDAKALSDRRAR
jgi:hypothetical protein